jgi:hypothetical protein
MLTALIRNWRESAEFLILAPTIEIANNSFFPARDMVRKTRSCRTCCTCRTTTGRSRTGRTGATLKVVAADNETVGGKKATGVLVDELWLFGKQPNAENMLREATGGLASRPEGFTIYLTTQSDEPPAGVFRQKLIRARRAGRADRGQALPAGALRISRRRCSRRKAPAREALASRTRTSGRRSIPEFLDRELQKAEHAGERACAASSRST